MECIYLPELEKESERIEILSEEARHLKALRLKPYEQILATNGRGLTATISVENIGNKLFATEIQNFQYNLGEISSKFGLALGVLHDRARLEFALEKSVELGVTDFYLLNTRFVQKKNYSYERLEAKAIAAMKQAKRSVLPKIHQLKEFNLINGILEQYDKIILMDETGKKMNELERNMAEKKIILVGPEGGFSTEEIDNLLEKHKTKIEKITLGSRRLRAETAAIVSVGLFSF